MLAASARADYSQGSALQDGLGERLLAAEADSGELVQLLRLSRTLTDVPGFEFALRERTMRLANLRHASCARVYRIDRVDSPATGLTVVSQNVEGVRLSDLLHVAHERSVDIDISTTVSVIRQLLPAVTLLHEHAPDIPCGLIAPERLIVTPRGRIAVAEQALGGAIEQLHHDADRLWREFRIAGAESTPVRFSHRTDVMCIGLVALALMLGRPLRHDEFPHRIPLLVDAARERTAPGRERRLSEPLRDWLARALQLSPGGSFASSPEAWLAFERVIAADPLYISVPIALEIFLYRCTAARIPPPAIEETPERELPLRSSAPPPSGQCNEAASNPPAASAFRSGAFGDEILETSPAPGAVPPRSAAASASIDWAGVSPAYVATSSDIAQLFSDADTPSPDVDGAEPPAAASLLSSPDAPDAWSQEFHGDLAPMPQAVPGAMQDAPQKPQWTQAMPFSPRPLLRIFGVAAVIVGLLAGGLLLTRWLRPAVIVASGMGTLVVETNPPGLHVLVDGVEQGLTPSRLSVPAGEHTLEVRGREVVRVLPFTIAAGTEVSQYLELPAAPETVKLPIESAAADATTAPPRVPTADSSPATQTWGWLAVKAPFPIEIHLGGRLVATTSGQRVRIVEGRHQVEFRNRTKPYRAVRVVHIAAGKVTDIILDGEAAEP